MYHKFYTKIKEGFDALSGVKKLLVESGLKKKLENLRNKSIYTHGLFDKLVFSKTKAVFGGRVRYMVTGSAPLSKEVLEFLKVVACCPVIEGFGQTESSAASFVTESDDPTSGHVGGPVVSCEVKL